MIGVLGPSTDLAFPAKRYFCPVLQQKLSKQYLPLLPLWSGFMLNLGETTLIVGDNRDSNTTLEKHICIKSEITRREITSEA